LSEGSNIYVDPKSKDIYLLATPRNGKDYHFHLCRVESEKTSARKQQLNRQKSHFRFNTKSFDTSLNSSTQSIFSSSEIYGERLNSTACSESDIPIEVLKSFRCSSWIRFPVKKVKILGLGPKGRHLYLGVLEKSFTSLLDKKGNMKTGYDPLRYKEYHYHWNMYALDLSWSYGKKKLIPIQLRLGLDF
jgi:hypothetical protein